MTPRPKVAPAVSAKVASMIPLTVNHLSQAYAKLYEKLYGALSQPQSAQKPRAV
jgi:hypothetical protein